MKTETYILPSFWASPLINNDYTSLDAHDINALESWLEKYKPGYCVSVGDDEEFKKYHDAREFVLACQCCEFVFYRK